MRSHPPALLIVFLLLSSFHDLTPQTRADPPKSLPVMLCEKGLWNDGGLLLRYDSAGSLTLDRPEKTLDLKDDLFMGYRTREQALRVDDLDPSACWLRFRNGDLWRIESLRLSEERLRIRHAILGRQTRPLDDVAAMYSGEPDLSAYRLTPPSDGAQPTDDWDLVHLRDGQKVRGFIDAIDENNITMESDTARLKLPLTRVERIDFFDRTEPEARERHRQDSPRPVQLDLVDGSSVSFEIVHADRYGYTASRHDERLPRPEVTIPTTKVRALWQRAGFWKWLGESPPEALEGRSMLGEVWPVVRDRTVMGDPMIVGGRVFTRGLGMHATSRATWKLEEPFTRLRGAVALDDSAHPHGRVDVQIRVDAEPRFVVNGLRAGMAPRMFDVPLSEGATLELIAEAGAEGEIQDRVNWLDMFLMKLPPATGTQAP